MEAGFWPHAHWPITTLLLTVIERDEFPAECKPRKGVPQAQHVRRLLAKGAREVLEQLFQPDSPTS